MIPKRLLSHIPLLVLCSSIPQVFCAPTSEAPAEALAAAPSVTIASGVVVGTTVRPSNQPTIAAVANAYLGIPFAQSPPERFSPPEPAPAWPSPLQAQAFKPSCIQQFVGTEGEASRELNMQYFENPLADSPMESEDCLYLNVYTPPGVTPTSKKAVMFWIYGGNLQFGNAGQAWYDGSSLATTQDVIVVTFNYRTNIFGFSNSPDIPSGLQNAGFLDQRFALEWVQDNIARFGGDPSRVMLFGESAGGESVKQLLANPPDPLPFASAIMQSEQSLLIGNGLVNWNLVLKEFGCEDTECLKSVPAEDIKAYIEEARLAFPPVNDDETSIDDVRPSIKSGRWAKVPVMIGSNLNEARVFLSTVGLNDGPTALDAVFDFFNIGPFNPIRTSIVAAYTAKGITDLLEVVDRILTDLIFTCTTSSLANYLARYRYTTYRYRYDGEFPSVSTFPNAGAYHTAEIPSVFGTYPLGEPTDPTTQQQIDLSAFMQRTWANFAKYPGAGVGWPRTRFDLTDDLGLLGSGTSSGVEVVSKLKADYACLVYEPLGNVLKFSYR